jgi:dodecin
MIEHLCPHYIGIRSLLAQAVSANSQTSFDDAVKEPIDRANKTLRGVESAWVKDMNVLIENGNITGYKMNVAITFVLEN